MDINWNKDQGQSYENRGPSAEAIDAFVLTFRFFIQNNEKISFYNMASVYRSQLISQVRREQFDKMRNDINNFLDSKTEMVVQQVNDKKEQVSIETLTHRQIMDTFIYGGLSHADENKKKKLDSWLYFAPSAVTFNYLFVRAIVKVLGVIVYTAVLNEQVLKEI